MQLDRLVEELAIQLDLEATPQEDKNGFFQLKIHLPYSVSMKDLNPGVFITSRIMELPKEKNKEDLYIHIMKANLLGKGTGGAAIGIDHSEKYLTLSKTLSFEVTYSTFYVALEDFINYIQLWSKQIPIYIQRFLTN